MSIKFIWIISLLYARYLVLFIRDFLHKNQKSIIIAGTVVSFGSTTVAMVLAKQPYTALLVADLFAARFLENDIVCHVFINDIIDVLVSVCKIQPKFINPLNRSLLDNFPFFQFLLDMKYSGAKHFYSNIYTQPETIANQKQLLLEMKKALENWINNAPVPKYTHTR